MTGLAVRESVTVAGRAKRARVARAFVGAVLGLGHPCGDVAVMLVSELFGNSVRHSGSGAPGETVAVRAGKGVVWVEVTDRSGPGCRSCVLPVVMRKAAAGFSSSRASRRGGDGGGTAGGRWSGSNWGRELVWPSWVVALVRPGCHRGLRQRARWSADPGVALVIH